MLNLGSEDCKKCIVGIKFSRFRITQEEADLSCKRKHSYQNRKQEIDSNQLDMFTSLIEPPVRLTYPRLTIDRSSKW